MRIAILFPSIYASAALFPDKIFAPRELCIDLVNGLVGRGHEVTVYSAPDLPTTATLVSEPMESVGLPPPYFKFHGEAASRRRIGESEFAKHRFELALVSRAFADCRGGRFDVVHVYHDSSMFLSHYFEEAVGTVPVVYTLHDPLPPVGTYEYEELTRFARHRYVSISNSFRRSDLKIDFVDTVYHGIDMTVYLANDTPGDSCLFLGRLVAEKGLHNAVAAASRSGVPLTVSVNLPVEGEENPYYEGIKQDIEAHHCRVLPVVDKQRRIELYGSARALLFPIEWEEPFGMVMIEAMACGTPVIAYNRGSVAEIVRDGVTGFIVDQDDTDRPGRGSWTIKTPGVAGLVEAIGRIGELDRKAVRRHTEERFTQETMVRAYETVYQRLTSAGK